MGVRIAVFLSAAPLSTCFSGALAYGITSGHPSLAKWRLLFLVEGLPTICMAPIAYFFLPDEPSKARFFTDEEKKVAKARGVRQVGGVERVGGIVWKEVGAALLDLKCWFTALYVSFESISLLSWSWSETPKAYIETLCSPDRPTRLYILYSRVTVILIIMQHVLFVQRGLCFSPCVSAYDHQRSVNVSSLLMYLG